MISDVVNFINDVTCLISNVCVLCCFFLSGEKVDVYVMREPPSGDWEFICTTVTDKAGRVAVTLPSDKKLPYGMFPIKMIVR